MKDKQTYEQPTVNIYYIRAGSIICASLGDEVYNGDTDPAEII